EKILLLAKKLLEKTIEGKIDWQEDPFEDAFYTQIGISSAHVVAGNDYSSLQIRNSSGTTVGKINTNDEDLDYDGRDLIAKLYNQGRRRAMGTDQILDNMLSV